MPPIDISNNYDDAKLQLPDSEPSISRAILDFVVGLAFVLITGHAFKSSEISQVTTEHSHCHDSKLVGQKAQMVFGYISRNSSATDATPNPDNDAETTTSGAQVEAAPATPAPDTENATSGAQEAERPDTLDGDWVLLEGEWSMIPDSAVIREERREQERLALSIGSLKADMDDADHGADAFSTAPPSPTFLPTIAALPALNDESPTAPVSSQPPTAAQARPQPTQDDCDDDPFSGINYGAISPLQPHDPRPRPPYSSLAPSLGHGASARLGLALRIETPVSIFDQFRALDLQRRPDGTGTAIFTPATTLEETLRRGAAARRAAATEAGGESSQRRGIVVDEGVPEVPTMAFEDGEVELPRHLEAVRVHIQALEAHAQLMQRRLLARFSGLEGQIAVLVERSDRQAVQMDGQRDRIAGQNERIAVLEGRLRWREETEVGRMMARMEGEGGLEGDKSAPVIEGRGLWTHPNTHSHAPPVYAADHGSRHHTAVTARPRAQFSVHPTSNLSSPAPLPTFRFTSPDLLPHATSHSPITTPHSASSTPTNGAVTTPSAPTHPQSAYPSTSSFLELTQPLTFPPKSRVASAEQQASITARQQTHMTEHFLPESPVSARSRLAEPEDGVGDPTDYSELYAPVSPRPQALTADRATLDHSTRPEPSRPLPLVREGGTRLSALATPFVPGAAEHIFRPGFESQQAGVLNEPSPPRRAAVIEDGPPLDSIDDTGLHQPVRPGSSVREGGFQLNARATPFIPGATEHIFRADFASQPVLAPGKPSSPLSCPVSQDGPAHDETDYTELYQAASPQAGDPVREGSQRLRATAATVQPGAAEHNIRARFGVLPEADLEEPSPLQLDSSPIALVPNVTPADTSSDEDAQQSDAVPALGPRRQSVPASVRTESFSQRGLIIQSETQERRQRRKRKKNAAALAK